MKKHLFKNLLLLVLLCISVQTKLLAQQFPVTVNTILTTPTLPYLEDFLSDNPHALMLQVILNDPTVSQLDVGLRLTISGQGISIMSDPLYLGDMYTLDFNLPEMLTGYDLSQYFDPDNLIFSGMTKSEYLSNGRLPEGFYSICFETYDYNNPNSLPISNRGCGTGIIEEYDPPILLSLLGESPHNENANYVFQWQPMHPGSFPVDYYLDIYEKIPGMEKNQIIESESPYAQVETQNFASFVYGLAEPLLTENQAYIMRLQVVDPTGQHLFKNNGYSAMESFTLMPECVIGTPCDDLSSCTENDVFDDNCNCVGTPISDSDGDGICDEDDLCEGFDDSIDLNENGIPDGCEEGCLLLSAPIVMDAEDVEDYGFMALWTSPFDCAEGYTLEVAKDSSYSADVEIYNIDGASAQNALISGIDLRESNYYYRVQSYGEGNSSPYSWSKEVRLGSCRKPFPDELSLVCGELDSTIIKDSPLLTGLEVGAFVTVADYQVEFTQVVGYEQYSGRAKYSIEQFPDAQINLVFENIRVNEDCQMVEGYMQVEGFGLALISPELSDLLDQIIAGIDLGLDALEVLEEILEQVNEVINETEGINDYLTDDWDITDGLDPITDEYPYLDPSVTDAVQDAMDCFLTNPNLDTCVQQLMDALDDLQDAIENLYNADYQVEFDENAQSVYGYDRWKYTGTEDHYDRILVAKKPYDIPWKSVKSAAPVDEGLRATKIDEAALDGNTRFDNNKPPAEVLTVTPVPADAQSADMQFSGKLHEEVHQIYAVQTDLDSTKIAGKANIITYDEIKLNVTFVELTNSNTALSTNLPFTLSEIQDSLQLVFGSAVVQMVVHPTIQVNSDLVQMPSVPSGLLSNYTDAMKALNEQIMTVEEMYYIFLVDSAEPNEDGGIRRGFMPRGREFGYVYLAPHALGDSYNKSALSKTIAHELAHGAYKLRHIDDILPEIADESTDLLMDNNVEGKHLTHMEWDKIHNPDSDIGLFDGDDEGELVVNLEFEHVEFTLGGGKTIDASIVSEHYFFTKYKDRIQFTNEQIQKIELYISQLENPKYLETIKNKEGDYFKIVRSMQVSADGIRQETADIYFLCYSNLKEAEGTVIIPGGSPLEFVDFQDSGVPSYWKNVLIDNDKYAFKIENRESCAIDSLILEEKASSFQPVKLTYSDCSAPTGMGNGNGTLVIDFTNSFDSEIVQRAIDNLQSTENTTEAKPRIYIFSKNSDPEDLETLDKLIDERPAFSIIITLEILEDGTHKRKFYFGPKITDSAVNLSNALKEVSVELTYISLDLLTDLLDGLSHLVGFAEIPARYYNPDSVDPITQKGNYSPVMRDIFSIVTSFQLLEEMGINSVDFPGCDDKFSCEFASFAGIYNGLIKALEGFPEFASLLIKLITNEEIEDSDGNSSGKTYRQEISNAWNKFNGECKSDSIALPECIWNEIYEKFSKSHSPEELGNMELFHYQIGKDFTNLALFVIPFSKAGSLAKVNNLLVKLDATTYVFQGAGKLLRYAKVGAVHTYHIGLHSSKLILVVTMVNGKAAFKIIANGLDEIVDATVKVFLQNNPGRKFAVIDDHIVLGIDNSSLKIDEIVNEVNAKVEDAYGNFLVEIKKTGENSRLGLAGKFKILKFDALVASHQGNQAVVDALQGLTAKQKVRLDNDLISSTQFETYMKGLVDDGVVKAWDRVRTAIGNTTNGGFTKFATDIPTLESVTKLIADGSAFRNKVGSNWQQVLDDIIKKAKDGPCSSCGGSGLVGRSEMGAYLDDVDHFIKNFEISPGSKGETFYNWMRGTTNPNSGQLDELHQTLSDFTIRGITESDVVGIGKQFPNGTKKYDLRRIGDKYTEYKNKDFVTYPLTANGSDVDQMINGYIKNINKLDDVDWMAGLAKLKNKGWTDSNALSNMKNQWQSVFSNPTVKNNLFDAIWGNPTLKQNTFGSLSETQARAVLDNWISTTDDALFKFIKAE